MANFNSSTDYYYETSASALTYSLYCDGMQIYRGKSIKSPSQPLLRINISERVRDWLAQNMPDFREYDGEVVQHPDALKIFELKDDIGTTLETYRVLLDYSTPFTGSDMILSEPVNGHVDSRQKIFWSSFNNSARNVNIEIAVDLHLSFNPAPPFYIDGSGGTLTINYTANTDFTFSYDGGGWFTASTSNGVITINADENEGEGRDGRICFTYYGADFQTHTVCYRVVQGSVVNYCVESAITYETAIGYRNENPWYPGPWAWCDMLKYANCPNLISTTGGTFLDCENLEVALVPRLEDTNGIATGSGWGYNSGMFSNCFSLTSISLPSIKHLGNITFAGCYNLSAVTIGSGLTVAGTEVFNPGNLLGVQPAPLTITYLGTREQLENVTYAGGNGHNWLYSSVDREIHIVCSDGVVGHSWCGNEVQLIPDFRTLSADTFARPTIMCAWAITGQTPETLTFSGSTSVTFSGHSIGDTTIETLDVYGGNIEFNNVRMYRNNNFRNFNISGNRVYLNLSGSSGATQQADMTIASDGQIIFAKMQGMNLGSLTIGGNPTYIGLDGTDIFRGNNYLTAITFLGTQAQFQAVWHRVANWKRGSSLTVIHCTDGDITL